MFAAVNKGLFDLIEAFSQTVCNSLFEFFAF